MRKEQRCGECHEDFQNGIYEAQMLESVNGCPLNLTRFANWADCQKVKGAMRQLMDKTMDALKLQVCTVPVEPEEGAEKKDEDGKEEDVSSVTTVESGWEILEKGGKLVLQGVSNDKKDEDGEKAEDAGED